VLTKQPNGQLRSQQEYNKTTKTKTVNKAQDENEIQNRTETTEFSSVQLESKVKTGQ